MRVGETRSMHKTFIPFSLPEIGEEEIAEVVDTLRSGWLTTGPRVMRFEQEFAAYLGAPGALAVNSCTAALQVALAAVGIGAGDAVLSTPMTFCSSVHVIEHLGARPVLVDVEADTLNIDPKRVEAAVARLAEGSGTADRPRALLPVHLYGHPCDLDALMEIAREFRLAVIEDAAHALPASYKGRLVGSCGSEASVNGTAEGDGVIRLAAFSFYATKNLTTAEGGMLTGPIDVLERARMWSLHGMSRDAWKRYRADGSWHYEVVLPGYKCNMTDLQAAIGLHQLRKLSTFQARRREIVRRYSEAFRSRPELRPPTERAEVDHAWHLYALRLNLETLTVDRARFIEELGARGVGASVHFIPIHLHPYYRAKYGFRPDDFPIAYAEYGRLVSLPLHTRMTDADADYVIQAVLDIVTRHRR